MISDAFLNKMFCINILILIAFTKQILNLMYLYILIWKRQVATNDIKSVRCISPIILLRERPLDSQGGGAWVFFEKNILALVLAKKNILALTMCEKNILAPSIKKKMSALHP